MKVLYLHQYFRTPEEGGAIRSYHLARGLVDEGHQVEMVTAHNLPNSETKTIQGIRVHYLPVAYSNHLGFGPRVAAFLKFAWLAGRKASRIEQVDLCYCTSTPITIGLVALYLKWRFGIRYIFEVRDLWPEAPIQLEFIKNRILKNVLYSFEKVLYRHSERVVALSPGMAQSISAQAPGTEVLMIPNMADCDFFEPEAKSLSLVQKFNIQADFVISYLGALGRANRVNSILDLAWACKDLSVMVLVAGDGPEKETLVKAIEKLGLTNIRYLGFQNRETIRKILNLCDSVFVSFQDVPALQLNSPNKLFDGLAAGKMVIVNTDGWIRQIVEDHACGFYWSGKDTAELVKRIVTYMQNPELLQKSQRNARKLGETQFSKKMLVQKFLDVVKRSESQGVPKSKVYTRII